VPLSRWSLAELRAELLASGLVSLAAWDIHHARLFGRLEPTTGIDPFGRLVEQVMSAEPSASAGPTWRKRVQRRRRVLVALRDGERGGRLARIVTQLAVSRAPRTVMTTTPAANTRAAQSAAPRSCGGWAGQTHGVVQAAWRACRVTTR
jgi:hypothetical protein